MKKKCMVVVWNGSNHTITVPKLFKYIMRYFFISGDSLCYTKTKKERDTQKPYKVLVDLQDVVALHVFETKMEVVVEGGKHIVLKSSLNDIKRWVPALASRLLPKMDSIVAHIPPPLPLTDSAPSSPLSTPLSTPPSSPPQTPYKSSHTPPPTMPRPNSNGTATMFPFATTATTGEHPATPPYRAPHPMLNKLPSFRSQSSLSFTLTSKQRANWFGPASLDDSHMRSTPHAPNSPVRELGWDDWENIFNKFQRNEDIS